MHPPNSILFASLAFTTLLSSGTAHPLNTPVPKIITTTAPPTAEPDRAVILKAPINTTMVTTHIPKVRTASSQPANTTFPDVHTTVGAVAKMDNTLSGSTFTEGAWVALPNTVNRMSGSDVPDGWLGCMKDWQIPHARMCFDLRRPEWHDFVFDQWINKIRCSIKNVLCGKEPDLWNYLTLDDIVERYLEEDVV